MTQITISKAYIRMFNGNLTHSAVLTEIERIAVTYPSFSLFPLAHGDIADELCVNAEQVRYSVRVIKSKLNHVIKTHIKKFNDIPTVHYSVDIEALLNLKGAVCQ